MAFDGKYIMWEDEVKRLYNAFGKKYERANAHDGEIDQMLGSLMTLKELINERRKRNGC